jgi:hypothetical protein
MKYRRHGAKVGTYGEYSHDTWRDATDSSLLAEMYQKDDGTYDVTLYNRSHIPYTHNLRDSRIAWDVCEAHMKERGYDNLVSDTADIRAYND